ncbi:MAG: 30S ribosomal protein S8 [Parachlamydia sp.]|jgi:small subunit ribosomal protein S8|nr:MAG: 30S ribosomal protein S8 [Parachlamydia sp.]
MAVSDPVADFLTRIRNASRAQRRFVVINWSKLKEGIAEILKNQGFVESFLVEKDENQRGIIRIYLKYTDRRESVIKGLERVSKPGLRRYVKYDDIPFFYGGLGLSILSTSQGLLPGGEAKKRKIGGELLCRVW